MPRAWCLVLLITAQCARGPEAPDLASYGELDPDVASLLSELTTAVNAAKSDADRWGRLGMALEANGLLVDAESAYATAVELADREPRWRYRQALLRNRRGDHDAALADLDRVIALAPDYTPARWRRGLWLLDRGDAAAARAAFEDAVRIAPRDSGGHIGLALTHLSKREDGEAALVLERLLASQPGDRYAMHLLGTAYRRLGREDDARFALKVGASGEPAWTDPWSDDVQQYRRGFPALLKEATQLGGARRFDEAIALLDQLVKRRPDDRSLQVYLGGMYAAAGRVREAKAILDPILAAEPDHFDALMHLASGHLFAGELDTAASFATRALALRPGSADAAKLQGLVAWQREDLKAAESMLSTAAAADPRDPMPHLWAGMILGQQRRYADARRRFDAALERNPLLGDAWLGVADTYAAVGEFARAITALKRAEQVEPANPRLAAARDRILAAAPAAR